MRRTQQPERIERAAATDSEFGIRRRTADSESCSGASALALRLSESLEPSHWGRDGC